MLIYKDEDNLVTTSFGDPYRNMDLMHIRFEAHNFGGVENRFFKVLSTDSITRGIKRMSRDSMNAEAIRRFTRLTGEYDSCESYDPESNVGYKVYPFMRKNPTIYSFSMLCPAITQFFKYWDKYYKNGQVLTKGDSPYDLSTLFQSMHNFEKVKELFSNEEGERLRELLYQQYPEFAIFCYEIYPHLNIEIVEKYDIHKLINTRLQVQELGFETSRFDGLIDSVPTAENNSQVLELIRKIN